MAEKSAEFSQLLVGRRRWAPSASARRPECVGPRGYTVCILPVRDGGQNPRSGRRAEGSGLAVTRFSRRIPAPGTRVQIVRRGRRKERGPSRSGLFNARIERNKPCWTPPKSCSSGLGACLTTGGFMVAEEVMRATCFPRGPWAHDLFTGAPQRSWPGQGFAAFSSAKFGFARCAQARQWRANSDPRILLLHLLIDPPASIAEAIHISCMKAAKAIEARDIPAGQPDQKVVPSRKLNWFRAHQAKHGDGWTNELDLSPSV